MNMVENQISLCIDILKSCSYFQELGQLYSLSCDGETVDPDKKEHLINVVLNNCRIMY